MEALSKRFEKFDLEIHPTKSRITPFLKPSSRLQKRDRRRTETWTFLGFTFYWGKSFAGDYWIIKVKTSKKSYSKALDAAKDWCKANRHKPVRLQYLQLMKKIRGHQAYFSVVGNSKRCRDIEFQILRIWKKWLSRRSREKPMTFEKFNNLLESLKFLTPPLPPIARL